MNTIYELSKHLDDKDLEGLLKRSFNLLLKANNSYIKKDIINNLKEVNEFYKSSFKRTFTRILIINGGFLIFVLSMTLFLHLVSYVAFFNIILFTTLVIFNGLIGSIRMIKYMRYYKVCLCINEFLDKI